MRQRPGVRRCRCPRRLRKQRGTDADCDAAGAAAAAAAMFRRRGAATTLDGQPLPGAGAEGQQPRVDLGEGCFLFARKFGPDSVPVSAAALARVPKRRPVTPAL